MKQAVIVEAKDIKKILADYYKVQEKDIMQNKYSYTIILEREENENEND